MGCLYHYQISGQGDGVFIATPSLSGATSPGYQLSLLRSIEAVRKLDIPVHWCMLAYDCHVDDSRNFLVREFLKTDCDCLFFIDSDVGWNEDHFVRLVVSDKDMVAGVYPKKSDDDNEWPVNLLPGEQWVDDDGWLEVSGVPTGFLRMSRECVQMLYDSEGKKFKKRHEKNQIKQAIIFERTYSDGLRTGGDYAMCQKWRDLGGRIFIDPEMRFIHEGVKEWSGRLSYHLLKKNGLLENQIEAILHEIENGSCDDEQLIKLHESWRNGRWTVSPELLSSLAMILNEKNFTSVLEFGSGLSTLVLAAIGKRKEFRIESVEQDKQWFSVVKRYLDRMNYDLDLVYAPLNGAWYDYEPKRTFDFMLCDGPCRHGAKAGDRIGITNIKPYLSEHAVLLIDDFEEKFKPVFSEFTFLQYHTFAIGFRK